MKSSRLFAWFAIFSAIVWCGADRIIGEETDVDQQLLDEFNELDADLLGGAGDGDLLPPAADNDSTDAADERKKTDEDLLRKFDVDDGLGDAAGEDIPEPGDGATVPVDELGEDVHSLTRITQKMRRAEQLVPEKDELATTKTLQDEIANDLAELIKQLQQQKQQQSSSSKSSNQRQQSQRSKIRPSGQKPQSKPGNSESQRPAEDSSDELRDPKTPEIDIAQFTDEIIKEIWGHLPEKEREQLRQASAEQIMPNHETAIEKYFRRLREGNDQLR